jgi:hypothetical protein
MQLTQKHTFTMQKRIENVQWRAPRIMQMMQEVHLAPPPEVSFTWSGDHFRLFGEFAWFCYGWYDCCEVREESLAPSLTSSRSPRDASKNGAGRRRRIRAEGKGRKWASATGSHMEDGALH